MEDKNISSAASKDKQRAHEILEVEDEEERHARMHDILAKLNASSGASASTESRLPSLNGQPNLPLEPNPELLSRIQAFLPQLADSNAELARRAQSDPDSVDIENVNADEAYIEMESSEWSRCVIFDS
ncbi:uncharacterized protein B0H18DRAFT_682493 [Fomitopsis serialis]|uniref:uncharacterized protein n=1 Tax=Fomitopsis serialis TaxID=139415 RepID=UPI002007928A|nr:uncharacterized protein B0H18DRAFT_682493 [Neoantrodia serialis]KAH9918074.1 hypothetical protein B0H18DRAFT_682493 [Neoantrodia serialis]